MKKIIAISIFAAVALLAIGAYVLFAYSGDNLGFEVISEEYHTAKVVELKAKNATEILIPDSVKINGRYYKVTEIGQYAFRDARLLEKVTLPSTLTDIWAGAFLNCLALKELVIPEGVTRIGNNEYVYFHGQTQEDDGAYVVPEDFTENVLDVRHDAKGYMDAHGKERIAKPTEEFFVEGAFEGCTALRDITLPSSLQRIGHNTFKGCVCLAKIDIPGGVKEIGMAAFKCCKALSDIHLPDSLRVIDTEAFAQCRSLEGINLPPALLMIESMAFSECDVLSDIRFGDAITEIGAMAFSKCTALKSITLPKSVTSIGNEAFSESGITGFSISAAIERIGDNPFIDCPHLSDLTVAPENRRFYTADGVLFEKESKRLIYYPQNNQQKDYSAPEGTLLIGAYAFSNNKHILSVTLPASVNELGDCAFIGCENMRRLNIKSPTPPVLTGSLFGTEDVPSHGSHVDIECIVNPGFKLVVPKGAEKNYNDDYVWLTYLNIEDDTAVVDDSQEEVASE